jgi:hypothetical protein
MKSTSTDGRRDDHAAREVKLDLELPAWQALDEEAGKTGMSIEELVGFSILYYLADRDSGRIARRVRPASAPAPAPLEPGAAHPLDKLLES